MSYCNCRLDGFEWGYFHKIWMKYYSLDENHNSRTLSSRFIACKNPYQLQNLKILSRFQGHKNAYGENFGIWIYFYLKRQGYIDITRTKSTWGHIMFVHKSYNEIIDEIIFISPKTGQKWILLFWGSSISLLLQIGYSSFQAS